MKTYLVGAACLLLLWTGTAGAQECELAGVRTLRHVVVRAPGIESIELQVSAEVIVRPTETEWHQVEVRGSLAFDAVSENIGYRLVGRVQTGHGMVSLSPHAPVDRVRAKDGGVQLTAHLTPWALIRRLDVACENIEVTVTEPVANVPPAASPETDGTHWRARGRTLDVWSEPGAGPRVRVVLERDSPFILNRVEVRAGWVRVHWSGRGNTVDGWVRRSALRAAQPHGWGTTGGSGIGACLGSGHAFREGLYRGPAELVPGAIVRHEPRGTAWASARASSGFVVMHDRGAAWVQVISAEGVSEAGSCHQLTHAWVRIEDVRLPADVESQRMQRGDR